MTTVRKGRYELSYITYQSHLSINSVIRIQIKERKKNIHLVNRIRIIKRLDKMSVGRNIQTPDLRNIQLHTSESSA